MPHLVDLASGLPAPAIRTLFWRCSSDNIDEALNTVALKASIGLIYLQHTGKRDAHRLGCGTFLIFCVFLGGVSLVSGGCFAFGVAP